MLADSVVVLHLLWIVFLIFGAIPGYFFRWVKYVHLGALAFSIVLQLFGWICPLTHLEVWLRRQRAPASTYSGGFIRHYVEKIVYVDISPPLILLGTLLVVAISLSVYFRAAKK
jgi:hypothetical protein